MDASLAEVAPRKHYAVTLHVHTGPSIVRPSLLSLYLLQIIMEEGTKSKKTVFVGGVADDVDEGALYESFSTFGVVICPISRYIPSSDLIGL